MNNDKTKATHTPGPWVLNGYPEDEEDNEFYDEELEVYMAAQDAEDWLDGVGEGLADGWEPLVVA